MISNPRFYQKVTKATSKLVASLTDFEEGSENYEACVEFALQKFQNHRFLDVDNNKIDQRLDGLCEKFAIHSQPQKADILKELKSSFLSHPIGGTPGCITQIHYSLLSVLLDLSTNPVNREYKRPVPKEQPVEEKFDWAQYLLEGEELLHPTQWAWDDTPCSSEDEDDQSPEVHVEDERWLKEHDSARKILPSSIGDAHSELITPYWNKSNTISVYPTIDEVNVIREVLWLLGGQSGHFLFPVEEGRHKVCEKFLLSHLTTPAVKSSLEYVAKHGDMVGSLREFVFDNLRPKCQTYKAFSESLLKFHRTLQHELVTIEKRIIKAEETVTLGDVLKILSPRMQELSVVDWVFRRSIEKDIQDETWAKKAARLLGELYDSVIDLRHTSSHSLEELNTRNSMISIWLDSIKPYIDIIDNWVSSGQLVDPHSEFILQRSANSPEATSDEFWYKGFSLVEDECLDCLSWLKPIVEEIAVAGKSAEVLVSLSKGLRKTANASLHSSFVQKIASARVPTVVASNKDAQAAPVLAEIEPNRDVSNTVSDSVLRLNFEKVFGNTSLVNRDQNVGATHEVSNCTPLPVLIQRSLHELIRYKCQNASEAILKVFMEEHKLLAALEVFQRFHLMGWGDVMHDFTTCLFSKMSAGEYWEDLMSLRATMEEAIEHSRPDSDPLCVTPSINREKQKEHGANQLIHATDIIELVVQVDWPLNIIITRESSKLYGLIFSYLVQVKHALYCLERLDFRKIYGDFDTRGIAPESSEDVDATKKAHRLSLLRSKILSLVLHWHNFIMTSVIQAEKETFWRRLHTVNDINGIIVAHGAFLDRVCTLCLLKQEKQADKMIQGTLQKIFNLCLVLCTKWNRGISSISLESIKKHEGQYRECSEFLGIILQNLVSRGAVPLSLESLAFCLMS